MTLLDHEAEIDAKLDALSGEVVRGSYRIALRHAIVFGWELAQKDAAAKQPCPDDAEDI